MRTECLVRALSHRITAYVAAKRSVVDASVIAVPLDITPPPPPPHHHRLVNDSSSLLEQVVSAKDQNTAKVKQNSFLMQNNTLGLFYRCFEKGVLFEFSFSVLVIFYFFTTPTVHFVSHYFLPLDGRPPSVLFVS